MRKPRNFLMLVLVFILCLGINGCREDFESATFKTLKSAQITYDNSMKAAADAYKMGAITDEQKLKIINVANKFYLAYVNAVTLFREYKKGETDQNTLEEQIKLMSAKLADLLATTTSLGLEVE